MRWLLGTVSVLALAAGSSACLFPEYTFDEPEPSGGSGPGTTTTTSSVGGGGAGGQGGSGGAPPEEDCFAPGDEDGDALSDCADPDCDPDLECVPSFPVGWNNLGYVALFRGDAGVDPACPEGTTGDVVYDGNAALQNATATCSPCSCGAPQDRDCFITQDFNTVSKPGLQGAQLKNVPNCGNATYITEATFPSSWDGACNTNETFPGGQMCSGVACNQSIRVGNTTVSGGFCDAAGGQPSGASPTWAERGEACRATAGLTGCNAGSSCVLKPKAPWGSRVCIARAGDVSCPTGSLFTQKRVFHGDYTDDRSCSSCSCNNPSGGTCKVTVSFYGDAVCGGTPVAEIESGACGNLTGNPTIASWEAAITTAPSGGACSAVAGGGLPSGTVTPTDPTTFCCLP